MRGNSRTIYTIATITTLLLCLIIKPTTTHNKHFLSSFSVPRRTRERKIVNKYIYQSYNKDYYNNNNPYIVNLFLPVLCVCRLRQVSDGLPVGVLVLVCVPGGSSGLLKLSQPGSCWKPGKYWERYWGICF